MSSLGKLIVILLTSWFLLVSGEAAAQSINDELNSENLVFQQVDILLNYNDGIWSKIDRETGELIPLTELECMLNPGCADLVILPGLVVGIIIGAASNGIAAAIQGNNAGQVIAATVLGGAAGFYGGIAGVTTGFTRILWGARSIALEGGVLGIIGRNGP